MAEYYKIEKNPKNTKYFLILPTALLLEKYQPTYTPFCYTSLIVSCYNFPLSDFFKYTIKKFDGKILVENEYPYFKVCFAEKRRAEQFCTELNERMESHMIV